MARALVFGPSKEAIDSSLEARKYVRRLSRKLQIEHLDYEVDLGGVPIGDEVHSVAVLAGLSGLMLESGYMETELDTVFEPQELLKKLRARLPRDFPILAIVDDVYSDYIMATYIRAGASAVVGTGGQLFGVVQSRLRSWDDLEPYINQFRSV